MPRLAETVPQGLKPVDLLLLFMSELKLRPPNDGRDGRAGSAQALLRRAGLCHEEMRKAKRGVNFTARPLPGLGAAGRHGGLPTSSGQVPAAATNHRVESRCGVIAGSWSREGKVCTGKSALRLSSGQACATVGGYGDRIAAMKRRTLLQTIPGVAALPAAGGRLRATAKVPSRGPEMRARHK